MNFIKNDEQFLREHIKYLVGIIQERDQEIKTLKSMLNLDRVQSESFDPLTQDDLGDEMSSPSCNDQEIPDQEGSDLERRDLEGTDSLEEGFDPVPDDLLSNFEREILYKEALEDLSNHVYVKPVNTNKFPFVTEITVPDDEADDIILL